MKKNFYAKTAIQLREQINYHLHIISPMFCTKYLNYFLGRYTPHWCRIVMHREIDRFIRNLNISTLDVLEISGCQWGKYSFRSYQSINYPDYDLCKEPLAIKEWDLIIADQVLEHVLNPYRAVRHVWEMIRPEGYFIVTTPFLIRVHPSPTDCSRWTETGLKYFLAEGGFLFKDIQIGSWGNRKCLISNLERWIKYKPLWHSLENDPRYPIVVWAVAKKT